MTTIAEFTLNQPDGYPFSVRISRLENYVRSFLRAKCPPNYKFEQSKDVKLNAAAAQERYDDFFPNAKLVTYRPRLRFYRSALGFECDDNYLMTLNPEQLHWCQLFFAIALECDWRILESIWAARLQYPFFRQLQEMIETLGQANSTDLPNTHRFLDLDKIELTYHEDKNHVLKFIFSTSEPFK